MTNVLERDTTASGGKAVTRAAVAHAREKDSAAAGRSIGGQIAEQLAGERPDAVILFASAQHDYGALLRAVDQTCRPALLVGCSSAGEFTTGEQAEGAVSAIGLRAPGMRFSAGMGRGLRADRERAARELVASFQGVKGEASQRHPHRVALVLTDALAGHADDLVERLNVLTAGRYRFFGGGAGDDGRFQATHVFFGTEAVEDAVVALEILSDKPIGIGAQHGWRPASEAMRITEADGMTLVSLDNTKAAEVFDEHAEATDQRFDRGAPLPFFLQNVVGLDAAGGQKLRVPLGVTEAGAVVCAADLPQGATAYIMGTTADGAAEAAARATMAAVEQLGEHRPSVALFMDCVATRLRLGKEFGLELEAVDRALGGAKYVGFNSYGQIARAEGQFSGFHNCTAVVCVLPE